jgi:hypothetical protein
MSDHSAGLILPLWLPSSSISSPIWLLPFTSASDWHVYCAPNSILVPVCLETHEAPTVLWEKRSNRNPRVFCCLRFSPREVRDCQHVFLHTSLLELSLSNRSLIQEIQFV